jgi:hypothetical protein
MPSSNRHLGSAVTLSFLTLCLGLVFFGPALMEIDEDLTDERAQELIDADPCINNDDVAIFVIHAKTTKAHQQALDVRVGNWIKEKGIFVRNRDSVVLDPSGGYLVVVVKDKP